MATAEGLSRTVKVKGMRYYDVGVDKLFPSVTTILGAMTDKSGLSSGATRWAMKRQTRSAGRPPIGALSCTR